MFFILFFCFACVLNKIFASICSGNTYYDLSASSCRSYFSENVTGPSPWGIWRAQSYDTASPTVLMEARGNGRDVTIAGDGISKLFNSGNGAIKSVHSLTGGLSNIMIWPTLPDDFTICSMTRYTSSANRQRILTNTGTTCDWSHGHRAAKRGVAHYSAFRTLDLSFGTLNDWLVMCGQNSQTNLDANPRNIIADGINSFFVCLYSIKSSQINYFFRNCSWYWCWEM